MNQTKIKRGQKLCKECGGINASRQRTCKHCDTLFPIKKTPSKSEILDWKNIEKGTCIKVIQGTGPYYICTESSEEAEAGEKICMGSTGVYSVVGVRKEGLCAYGTTVQNGGFTFLYMGQPFYSKETKLYHEPYRIKKVKRKKRK